MTKKRGKRKGAVTAGNPLERATRDAVRLIYECMAAPCKVPFASKKVNFRVIVLTQP
ncbi:hypothetical protein HD841_001242 [Sphingomonas melonis]|uniref:Uncharacterized protein n=1 Tax=Sphingomonas melonis TaxID=152682 RepID=A0A7Y9FLR5_9SPHN|nr:hypothetical protein [Sphingomonas melonis]